MTAMEEDDRKPKKTMNINDQIFLQWQKELADQGHVGGISDRKYYKDLDFRTVKQRFSLLSQFYNAMEKTLEVKSKNKKEYREVIKIRHVLFKKIEETVNLLTFDWAESTASFSGSSNNRQEAYEAIIDEIKSALSSCNPSDEDQLEMFMDVFRHFVKWLMSQSLDYSLGERVKSTDDDRLGLEASQIQAAAGADAMQKSQRMHREALTKSPSRFFQRKGSHTPPGVEE